MPGNLKLQRVPFKDLRIVQKEIQTHTSAYLESFALAAAWLIIRIICCNDSVISYAVGKGNTKLDIYILSCLRKLDL